MYVPNKIWNILGYSMKNGIFQDMVNLYVPNLKSNIPKNSNEKSMSQGARKIEPGSEVTEARKRSYTRTKT